MAIDSKKWPWLVLGCNADMSSFTALAAAPTQAMAVEIAAALAGEDRAVIVAPIAHRFPSAKLVPLHSGKRGGA